MTLAKRQNRCSLNGRSVQLPARNEGASGETMRQATARSPWSLLHLERHPAGELARICR
jgi:hypothetical protein